MSTRTHLPALHPAVRIDPNARRQVERDRESMFLLDGTIDHLESAKANVEQALKDARTAAKWSTGPFKRIASCYRVGNNAVDAVLHGVSFGRQVLRGEAPHPSRIGGNAGVRIPAYAVDDYVSDLEARMRAAGGSFPDSEIGGADGLLLRTLAASRYGGHDDGIEREIRPDVIEPMLDFLAEELKAAGGDQRFIEGVYWLAVNDTSYSRYTELVPGPAAERFVECVKRTIGIAPVKPAPGAIDPADVDAYVAHVLSKIDRGGIRAPDLAPEDVELLETLDRDGPRGVDRYAERYATEALLQHAAYRLKAAGGDEHRFIAELPSSRSRASYATGPHLSHDAAKRLAERVKKWSAAPPAKVWEHPTGYDTPYRS